MELNRATVLSAVQFIPGRSVEQLADSLNGDPGEVEEYLHELATSLDVAERHDGWYPEADLYPELEEHTWRIDFAPWHFAVLFGAFIIVMLAIWYRQGL